MLHSNDMHQPEGRWLLVHWSFGRSKVWDSNPISFFVFQPQTALSLYTVALPVCKLRSPFLHLQKPMPPTMALTNQSSMLIKSIQTAFFILEIPPSDPGSTLMYIDPKRPNTAVQSMNRMASQPKRIAVVKELISRGRMA